MSVAAAFRKADPDWLALHRIADDLAPGYADEVGKIIDQLRRQLPYEDILAALETGRLDEVARAVAEIRLSPAAAEALRGGVSEAVTAAAQAQPFVADFRILNPHVVRYVDRHMELLQAQLSETNRRAVRDVIRRGFLYLDPKTGERIGMDARRQASLIRDIIGLTPRQAQGQLRFAQKSTQLGTPQRVLDRLLRRRRDRFVRFRAETIARTETIRATNWGQQLAWRTAADQGLLDRDTTRRVWIATDDDRTCAICNTLDRKTISLNGDFTLSGTFVVEEIDGKPMLVESADGKPVEVTERVPPAHPRCRCAVGLEFVSRERKTPVTRSEAANQYEAKTLEFADGGRVRVVHVVESGRRFFTAEIQRIRADGTPYVQDVNATRLRTMAHEAVTSIQGVPV